MTARRLGLATALLTFAASFPDCAAEFPAETTSVRQQLATRILPKAKGQDISG